MLKKIGSKFLFQELSFQIIERKTRKNTKLERLLPLLPSRQVYINNLDNQIRASELRYVNIVGTIVTLTIPTETLKKDQATIKIPSGQ